jgi:acylpyruvate hydrolase
MVKLLSFSLNNEKARVGALTTGGNVASLQICLGKYFVDVEGIERGEEIAAALIPDDMKEFIRGGMRSLEAARVALEYAGRKELELTGLGMVVSEAKISYLPPVPNPGKIICPGMNFLEHAREVDPGTALPEFPMGFIKVPSALVGNKRPVVVKSGVELVDYEVEMALVIGKKAKDVPEEKALDYVWGYSVFNDVSARAIQMKEMAKGVLLAGKNYDTFAPMGPYLVTRDEVANPGNLALSMKVNGKVRQQSNTDHMIFGVPKLISYWSGVMTLEPGDVIATGTPGGVAIAMKPDPTPFYLKPGDIMEAEVEGLGILANAVEKG